MQFLESESYAGGGVVLRQVGADNLGSGYYVDLYVEGAPRVAERLGDPSALTNYGGPLEEVIGGAQVTHTPFRIAPGATISIALVERCARIIAERVLAAAARERAGSSAIAKVYPTARHMFGQGIAVADFVAQVRRALELARRGRFGSAIED